MPKEEIMTKPLNPGLNPEVKKTPEPEIKMIDTNTTSKPETKEP